MKPWVICGPQISRAGILKPSTAFEWIKEKIKTSSKRPNKQGIYPFVIAMKNVHVSLIDYNKYAYERDVSRVQIGREKILPGPLCCGACQKL